MKKLLLPAAVALSGWGRPADSFTRTIPDTPQNLADELWASLEGTEATRASEISIQLQESMVTQEGDDLGVYEDETGVYATRPALPAREAVDAAAADWFAAEPVVRAGRCWTSWPARAPTGCWPRRCRPRSPPARCR